HLVEEINEERKTDRVISENARGKLQPPIRVAISSVLKRMRSPAPWRNRMIALSTATETSDACFRGHELKGTRNRQAPLGSPREPRCLARAIVLSGTILWQSRIH